MYLAILLSIVLEWKFHSVRIALRYRSSVKTYSWMAVLTNDVDTK